MARLGGLTVVLVVGATWRLTLLVVADRITERPRRWLERTGHRTATYVLTPTTDAGYRLWLVRCECRWISDPEHATTNQADADRAWSGHRARTATEGWRYVLTCPWCASWWLGLLVVASALTVGDTTAWQAVAVVLTGSAVTGLLSSLASPGEG